LSAIAENADKIEYVLKRHEPDGVLSRLGYFKTKRERKLGGVVNLPMGADREVPTSHPSRSQEGTGTPGHLWRIVAVDEPNVLILEYIRPHVPQR
jgi:hypothetical protein